MTAVTRRLITAPLIGAAFCMFLPFIGIALTLYAVGKHSVGAVARVLR